MARRRQGAKLVAALVTLGMIPAGCDVVNEANEIESRAPAENTADAFFAFADEFLKEKEALALLRRRGAVIDDTFAPGQYWFTIPGLAGEGSELLFPRRREVAPESLTLVPPPGLRLTLADLAARFGEPRRLPAMPGRAWLYTFDSNEHSYSAVLNADPSLPTSQVASLRVRR